jgi:hypothetical protein
VRFRTLAAAALLAAASLTQTGVASAAAPAHVASTRIMADDESCPFVGAQRVDGTGFDTCVPGGQWVYQDCAPGTVSVQGFGAAKYHIWCIVPD